MRFGMSEKLGPRTFGTTSRSRSSAASSRPAGLQRRDRARDRRRDPADRRGGAPDGQGSPQHPPRRPRPALEGPARARRRSSARSSSSSWQASPRKRSSARPSHPSPSANLPQSLSASRLQSPARCRSRRGQASPAAPPRCAATSARHPSSSFRRVRSGGDEPPAARRYGRAERHARLVLGRRIVFRSLTPRSPTAGARLRGRRSDRRRRGVDASGFRSRCRWRKSFGGSSQ
jgi:hypothetical protein